MDLKNVYVTVGTTKFDELINEITSQRCLQALKQRGCEKLVIQHGQGRPANCAVNEILEDYGIKLEQYEYKHETPRTDILNADLVIGHAGAGTCMDILNHRRLGIIVINYKLLDNHQQELAQQLSEEGYIYKTSVKELAQLIEKVDLSGLKCYDDKSNNMETFVSYLCDMMSQDG